MSRTGLYRGIRKLATTPGMIAVLGTALAVAVSLTVVSAGQVGGAAIAMDADDISGVVTGPRGPEAGVWVIAETTDLPTRLIKTVVTNDQGRYLLPDLPKATYDVWVRGYGLVDSAKVKATPGKAQNLTAVAAPNPQAAAQYYPAQYLAVAPPAAAQERLSRHGPERQRHLAEHQEPGRVGPQHRRHRRLHGVSSAGQQGHA